MEMFIEAAANIGFPIVVSIYLLTRFESKIESLTKSIDKLSSILDVNV
ncbi:MAG: YvrJ family protein [Clostridium sp.]|nr:YvrJ family protein [Clostridium sp.]